MAFRTAVILLVLVGAFDRRLLQLSATGGANGLQQDRDLLFQGWAVVTFGAYAGCGLCRQARRRHLSWLQPGEMLKALGMA